MRDWPSRSTAAGGSRSWSSSESSARHAGRVTARPPARPSGARALAAAAELGPFFRTDAQPDPDWSSWAALTTDPALLTQRAAEVRAVLAAGPGRPDVVGGRLTGPPG